MLLFLKIEFWNAALLQMCPNFSQKYTCLTTIKKCWNVSSRLQHFLAFVYLFVKYKPRHTGYKKEPIFTLSMHRSYLNEGHTHFKCSFRFTELTIVKCWYYTTKHFFPRWHESIYFFTKHVSTIAQFTLWSTLYIEAHHKFDTFVGLTHMKYSILSMHISYMSNKKLMSGKWFYI